MERMTVLINVKDRWCDNDEYDQYGELIRWPNPNPTVVWNSGVWNREEGQGVMMEMTASKFRELTGVIVYGGNIEPRGTHKLRVPFGAYTRLKAYRSGEIITPRRSKKAARVLPKRNKLQEVREGRAQQLAGVKPRIRRRPAK